MTPNLKTKSFIDTLVFDLKGTLVLNAVLRDEDGRICSSLDTELTPGLTTFHWSGFNDLPYGEYTLELSNDNEKKLLSLVKRI